MKKVAKVFGILAVVVCLGLAMTACTTGKYSKTTEISGTKTVITYNLKSGGKCEVTEKKSGKTSGTEKVSGTYELKDDGAITISAGKYSATGTLKDGKLVLIGVYAGEYTK